MVNYQSKTYLITRASTCLDQINVGIISEKADARKGDPFNPKWEVLVAKERADSEIKRDHFHEYWRWLGKSQPHITREDYWDIPLPRPIVSFYNKRNDKEYCDHEEFYDAFMNDDDIEAYCLENKFYKWKLITNSHPNIKG